MLLRFVGASALLSCFALTGSGAAVGALDTCPKDILSCTRDDVDGCCSPKNGLVVLTQQWDTRVGPSDQFTMHGLWPDRCDGTYNGNRGCDPSRSYSNIADIIRGLDSQLYADMKTYWPSSKGDDNWFWEHEWTKHGTCVTTLNPSCYAEGTYTKHKEVIDYFRKALELRSQYDIYTALEKHGIVPTLNKTYDIKHFKDAIKAEYGAEATLSCRGSQLQEVQIVFRVRGKATYVPTDALRKDTCRKVRFAPKPVQR
ncbi:hypothetical protein EV182_002189 [Spiromyces aspiralis]|uniref:Uncharacterized protein n=1 Tax=Spiromyces aspiralis TaxID=68401 RepID=A0ACC1HFM1_9FUNG|nr:hypothetical protein EV182_002189 [Spiromyces aspiralis]